jgi:hypothetical protein
MGGSREWQWLGSLFTYPMNWWVIRSGWKHGMS